MPDRRTTITFVFFACALGETVTARAADPLLSNDAARIRAAVAHGTILPLPRILAVAQRRVPGEVIKVELEETGDRLGYQVKILTPDGRVREIRLDARTAAILMVQED